eukprot:997287-Pelagomonas_calceolata.AAC.1
MAQVTLHTILLYVGGVIYIQHSFEPPGLEEPQACSEALCSLSLGYAHMFALLELHIRLSILWLLNTAPHCYPGKHGAVHECGMQQGLWFEAGGKGGRAGKKKSGKGH